MRPRTWSRGGDNYFHCLQSQIQTTKYARVDGGFGVVRSDQIGAVSGGGGRLEDHCKLALHEVGLIVTSVGTLPRLKSVTESSFESHSPTLAQQWNFWSRQIRGETIAAARGGITTHRINPSSVLRQECRDSQIDQECL
jgi:hypothetical protein